MREAGRQGGESESLTCGRLCVRLKQGCGGSIKHYQHPGHGVALLGEGGVSTRPWWLALLACGGAYWPLALEPSAGIRTAAGIPLPLGGFQNATSAHGVLP